MPTNRRLTHAFFPVLPSSPPPTSVASRALNRFETLGATVCSIGITAPRKPRTDIVVLACCNTEGSLLRLRLFSVCESREDVRIH